MVPDRPLVVYTDPTFVESASAAADLDFERERLSRFELYVPRSAAGAYCHDEEFRQKLRVAKAIVVSRFVIDSALANELDHCRLVLRQGVGLDNLDVAALVRRGIQVTNIPDYCVDEVVNHTLALFLAYERGILVQDRAARAGEWGPRRGRVPRRIGALVAGIVGFGRIGRVVAARIRSSSRETLAYDPWVSADTFCAFGATPVHELSTLLSRADVVFLHPSLNETSRRMINTEALMHSKPGQVLVNCARGQIVDPQAVLAALSSGMLAGYLTDVFSPEDPALDPIGRELLQREDVIVTCHRAFLSAESLLSLRARAVEHILGLL